MNEILSLIIKIVLTVLWVLAGCCILPWLKDRRIYSVVKCLVRAAEKLGQDGVLDKKSYVLSALSERGIEVTDAIDSMIEAAVTELDIELGKGAKTSCDV